MESSICVRQMVSAAHHQSLSFPKRRTRRSVLSQYKDPTRSTSRICRFRILVYSKPSDFLEYKDYKRPSRLLPTTDLKICTETTQEKIVTSLNLGRSNSLFKVQLQTSRLYDSSLSNMYSGVLLMLIDENGDSILQRIPSNLMRDFSDKLSFQRGSVDEFTFKGPKLGRIEALWIGLESGQWRLGGVNLTVLSEKGNENEDITHISSQYTFEAEDILLGEQSETPMVELRPSLATESSESDLTTLLTKTPPSPTSLTDIKASKEESMREYANLKFSLLFYDFLLIGSGTAVGSWAGGESVGFAFLTGGVGGFLYLWLLQRSVDGLGVSELGSGGGGGGVFDGVKSPVAVLVLVGGLGGLAVKFGLGGDMATVVSAKEVIVGMMGFVACKVAVVLAAVKPLPIEEKK